MRVLVTGGAGYIGSHTMIEVLAADHDVMVVDNFANSVPEALTALPDCQTAVSVRPRRISVMLRG